MSYGDYMGPYREQSSHWYGRNLRGALVEVLEHPPASGQTYVSRSIPYAGIYWRFYALALSRAPVTAPLSIDPESEAIRSAAPGSLAVVAADEPLASSLDRNGWRRAAVAAEPTGVPSFIVFQKP